MKELIEQLRKEAAARGLTVDHLGNGHYQIKGGNALVNYYPESKKRTAYVAGTRGGHEGCDPRKAVSLAVVKPRNKDLLPASCPHSPKHWSNNPPANNGVNIVAQYEALRAKADEAQEQNAPWN